jgi:protein gp37
MAKDSKIAWCRHTFNGWIGCTHKSEGCRFCYAEAAWDARFHRVQWGPKGDRSLTSDDNWAQPLKWNREATADGLSASIFAHSLSDVMDAHPSILPAWRQRQWKLIADTPNLDWLLLTKRPENWPIFLPVAEPRPPFENIRLGVSMENQPAADEFGSMLQFAADIGWPTFVSYGPAIGPIDWEPLLAHGACQWIVAEGESGPNARPAHPDWFRAARDACQKYRVPFLMKQWGEWQPLDSGCGLNPDHYKARASTHVGQGISNVVMLRTGTSDSGRMLDRVIWDEKPAPRRLAA